MAHSELSVPDPRPLAPTIRHRMKSFSKPIIIRKTYGTVGFRIAARHWCTWTEAWDLRLTSSLIMSHTGSKPNFTNKWLLSQTL